MILQKYTILRPKKIIVWLSSTTFLSAGGRIFFFTFFFFKSKSKLHGIIALFLPYEGANKFTLPKKSLHTSFKPVLKCKQVDNNNLKIFLKDQTSQRKKPFLEFLKLGAVYFYTVKTFSSFQKLWAGSGGQPNNYFFWPYQLLDHICFNMDRNLVKAPPKLFVCPHPMNRNNFQANPKLFIFHFSLF